MLMRQAVGFLRTAEEAGGDIYKQLADGIGLLNEEASPEALARALGLLNEEASPEALARALEAIAEVASPHLWRPPSSTSAASQMSIIVGTLNVGGNDEDSYHNNPTEWNAFAAKLDG